MEKGTRSFCTIVKKWTVKDYNNPKIKAEVIIDMLISDFVDEIVKKTEGLPGTGETRLVAKEFPINGYKKEKKTKIYNANTIKNSPAVDYVILRGNTLFLTELKTASDSFSPEQLVRMIMAKKKPEELWTHYSKVIQSTSKPEKYLNQLDDIMDNIQRDEIKGWLKNRKSDRIGTIIENRIKDSLGGKNIEILYIVIGDGSQIKELDGYMVDGDEIKYEVVDVFDEESKKTYGSNEIPIYVLSLKEYSEKHKDDELWNEVWAVLEECMNKAKECKI